MGNNQSGQNGGLLGNLPIIGDVAGSLSDMLVGKRDNNQELMQMVEIGGLLLVVGGVAYFVTR